MDIGVDVVRQQHRDRTDVIELAAVDDDGLGADVADRKRRRIPRVHPEIGNGPLVDTERAPTDLAGTAEKPSVHYTQPPGPFDAIGYHRLRSSERALANGPTDWSPKENRLGCVKGMHG
ncbi:hypothetical protein A6E15_01370 [Natrinema saccharevitans]|uniref:Uncharacterized protein n=1 Tax=Natrinema saccharevitans TaxID=301967 RepID=A0A1S8ASM0_9EURY|nr:hypothetical protein A6E15_01370 [Natrinema saccharevitans]